MRRFKLVLAVGVILALMTAMAAVPASANDWNDGKKDQHGWNDWKWNGWKWNGWKVNDWKVNDWKMNWRDHDKWDRDHNRDWDNGNHHWMTSW